MSLYELFFDKFRTENDKKSNDLYKPIEQLILIVRTHNKHFFLNQMQFFLRYIDMMLYKVKSIKKNL